MKVTVHKAKSDLSKLIEAALAGEEVIIARGKTPVVQLVPLPQSQFKIGLLAGQLGMGPDFFEPLSDSDLDLWEGKA
jgi:antitoxin (DNA-binding transcriptional repressor) of toxin-antitoxin stability system